ncbi:MAG TPA: T9SS type A sorting domain-containing protein [Saprospiraceae bacterium]|nr:T9SS type A sorting domain-containing protein [Saprospiraceae bacterium]
MRVIFLLVLIVLFNSGISQNISLILRTGDIENRHYDTCKIGFHPLATSGIDTNLGEEDITNTALGIGEIRVLQRGRADFECFQFNRRVDSVRNRFVFDTMLFNQSFDSKINIRPFTREFTGFEVKMITGSRSSVVISSTSSLFLSDIIDSISIKANSCNGITVGGSLNGYKQQSFSINLHDSVLVYILVFPKKSLYTNVDFDRHNEMEQEEIILFPNPCQDYITVSCNKDGISRYKLYDTQGNLRRAQSIAEGLREFSISDLAALSSGLYVLVLEDQKGNILSRKKMLKE